MSDDTLPIPLATFAATLRPRLVETRPVRIRGVAAGTIPIHTPGHADEIWLKLLQMNHKIERHTEAGWHKLIEKYRHMPAHPSDPNYVPGA